MQILGWLGELGELDELGGLAGLAGLAALAGLVALAELAGLLVMQISSCYANFFLLWILGHHTDAAKPRSLFLPRALCLPFLRLFLAAIRQLPWHIGSDTTAARPPRGGRRWCHCDAPTGGLG